MHRILKDIGKLGLVFMIEVGRDDEAQIDLHPLVREYFYRLLVNPKALHEKALELPRAKDLLAARPRPSDANEIHGLIDLIYHAAQAGKTDTAWQIYQDRLGGYPPWMFMR